MKKFLLVIIQSLENFFAQNSELSSFWQWPFRGTIFDCDPPRPNLSCTHCRPYRQHIRHRVVWTKPAEAYGFYHVRRLRLSVTFRRSCLLNWGPHSLVSLPQMAAYRSWEYPTLRTWSFYKAVRSSPIQPRRQGTVPLWQLIQEEVLRRKSCTVWLWQRTSLHPCVLGSLICSRSFWVPTMLILCQMHPKCLLLYEKYLKMLLLLFPGTHPQTRHLRKNPSNG